MSSKVKVIVTDIPIDYFNLEEYNKKHLEIATALQKEIGDTSIILNENRVVELVKNPETFSRATFIEPGLMSHKRRTMTKLNKLFTYLLAIAWRLDIEVIVLVGDYNWLDIRVKRMWDVVERLNHGDYERLDVRC